MFGQVLGRDKGFLVAIDYFWFCVATRVPCVATWISWLGQLLGRDSVLLLCCDNVVTEGFLVGTKTVTIRGQVLQ